ncbi:Uncharacterized protein TCM_030238 [Theobroma cacao]|uniref:Uncharacterized protein n=1 Tax=Theobroma cacao TaxID=3641 RepID=A0A061GH50_THECC|nr:Uncharacterized protein TCM_030238 [Theobroma cacao]
MEPYKLQSLLGAAHSGSILYLNREDMRRAKVSGIESMLVFISKGLREGRAVVVGRVVRAQSGSLSNLAYPRGKPMGKAAKAAALRVSKGINTGQE